MKRLTLILGAAAIAAISAPVSSAAAQTGCSWWDVACRGMTNTVQDGSWHIAGRDANGNVIYVRRRLDSNGNVIVEQSRRNNYGNYFVVNSHKASKVKYHPVKYTAPKVIHYDNDVKGAKPHKVDYHAAKGPEGKDLLKGQKGPKH